MPRRKWGGAQYSKLDDYLKYDPLFAEWYNMMGPGITLGDYEMPKTKVLAEDIDHYSNREIDEAGMLWTNTSQAGNTYWGGFLHDGRRFVIFKNQNVNSKNAPSHSLHVCRYTEEEREVLAEAAAVRNAERAEKEAAYKASRGQKSNGNSAPSTSPAPTKAETTPF